MVKGTSRRVIVVDSPDPRIFEQAIFILRSDAPDGVTSRQVVDQAVRIASSYARVHGSVPSGRPAWLPWLCGGLGALAIGLIWLMAALV